MTSIFSEIFKYRQREGSTPKENFFTETFVAVVNRSNLFRDEFVRWLFGLEPEQIQRPPKITTHRTFDFDNGHRRPDICVDEVRNTDNESHVAIIESKIDSYQRENQLNDYDSILVEEWSTDWLKTLVYITKYNEGVGVYQASEGINFKQRKWPDLYRTLATAMQENPNKVGALERELLKLMEDWHMNGINAAHLRSFTTCFKEGVGNRLVEIQNDAWTASGLREFLGTKLQKNKAYLGDQFSLPIQPYSVRIWVGFRCDRRDDDWDVDKLELPSPVVTIEELDNVDQEFPNMPFPWINDFEVYPETLWTRQPMNDERPRYGDPPDEYYQHFFQMAFHNILGVINPAIEGDDQ